MEYMDKEVVDKAWMELEHNRIMVELEVGGEELLEKVQKSLQYKKEIEEAMKANDIKEQLDRAR